MRYLKFASVAIAIGCLVALIYTGFEHLVRYTTSFIWVDLVPSDTSRLFVIPLCIIGALIFFGLQHRLDPTSEKSTGEALGHIPNLTASNLLKVLLLGFLSLVAGASLGPEAILVPASIIASGLLAKRLLQTEAGSVKLFSTLGFIALMAAFFHSFVTGLLAILLVKKQFGIRLSRSFIALALVTILSTVLLLRVLPGKSYFAFPPFIWQASLIDILACVGIIIAGYAGSYFLKFIYDRTGSLLRKLPNLPWHAHGLIAGLGLAILYLIGGPLVQFTGNESIQPVFEQAASLGAGGLLVVLIVKLAAIAWSKVLGYRGGMIFPIIFVASTLSALATVYVPGFNAFYGVIGALIGFFIANRRLKILL